MVILSKSSAKEAPSLCKVSVYLLSSMLLTAVVVLLKVTDPIFHVTQMHMHIYNGSEVYQFLTRPMHGVHISAYLFNITNAERFSNGQDSLLMVEEVGPFTYRENRTNEDLELDPENGVLRYSPKIHLEFLPEQSVARPEDVNVTMPNLPMLGMASQAMSFPYWSRITLDGIARQVKSKPLATMDAHSYLWGYKDPLLTLGNMVLPGIYSFDKIGILDRFYDNSKSNRLEVGATLSDTLMIKKRNGYGKLEMVERRNPDECDVCDSFENAYEGILYPGLVTPDTPIRIFRNGLCRLLPMVYNRKTTTDVGAEGLVFNLSDSFFSNDSKGLLDLSDCYYGIPISLSKTHLLDVDPKVFDRVRGMKPDPHKHNSYIVIEPRMAMALETYVQIQTNLVLDDLSYSSEAQHFSNMVIPIGYMTIVQQRLEDKTIDILKKMYVEGPLMLEVMEIICLVLALILVTYSVILGLRILSAKDAEFESELGIKTSPCLVTSAQEPLVIVRKGIEEE